MDKKLRFGWSKVDLMVNESVSRLVHESDGVVVDLFRSRPIDTRDQYQLSPFF